MEKVPHHPADILRTMLQGGLGRYQATACCSGFEGRTETILEPCV